MSKETIILIQITEESAGIRLDKALATSPELGSRSQATRHIDLGRVTLENKIVKPSLITEINQVFQIRLLPKLTNEIVPLELKLDIVHEDEALLVVNKPCGLVVHPAHGHHQDTLVNALVNHTKTLSNGFYEGRPGIVHRLDKDTSGLLVVAKTDAAHRILAAQFKNKSVHRIYNSICFGSFTKSKGTITSHLKRHPSDRKRFASSADGKLAITHFEVQKKLLHNLSLVSLRLETGRTHQIRVHLTELGHPIAGDPIYKTSTAKKNQNFDAPRLMLHAAELGFKHPTTKSSLFFKVDWPVDAHAYLKQIGER